MATKDLKWDAISTSQGAYPSSMNASVGIITDNLTKALKSAQEAVAIGKSAPVIDAEAKASIAKKEFETAEFTDKRQQELLNRKNAAEDRIIAAQMRDFEKKFKEDEQLARIKDMERNDALRAAELANSAEGLRAQREAAALAKRAADLQYTQIQSSIFANNEIDAYMNTQLDKAKKARDFYAKTVKGNPLIAGFDPQNGTIETIYSSIDPTTTKGKAQLEKTQIDAIAKHLRENDPTGTLTIAGSLEKARQQLPKFQKDLLDRQFEIKDYISNKDNLIDSEADRQKKLAELRSNFPYLNPESYLGLSKKLQDFDVNKGINLPEQGVTALAGTAAGQQAELITSEQNYTAQVTPLQTDVNDYKSKYISPTHGKTNTEILSNWAKSAQIKDKYFTTKVLPLLSQALKESANDANLAPLQSSMVTQKLDQNGQPTGELISYKIGNVNDLPSAVVLDILQSLPIEENDDGEMAIAAEGWFEDTDNDAWNSEIKARIKSALEPAIQRHLTFLDNSKQVEAMKNNYNATREKKLLEQAAELARQKREWEAKGGSVPKFFFTNNAQ
jgi:hypothetical protein